MSVPTKKLARTIRTAFLVALVAGTTYGLGFRSGAAVHRTADRVASVSSSHLEFAGREETLPSPVAQLSDEEFKVFEEAWNLIDQEFYGPLPPVQERIYGAITGMLETLGDTHTSFLTPEQSAIISNDNVGSFEGIGASIRLDEETGYPEIVQVFDKQPAFEAGLLPGDLILAVDGTNTQGASVLDTISLIRGPRDSTVHIRIIRESAGPDAFDVPVVRGTIDIPIVESEMPSGDIAYLRLTDFNSMAAEKLQNALRELLEKHPHGLILDLRGNPGGFLNVAVEVGSQFVGQGTIVSEKTKDGREDVFDVQPGGLATDSSLRLVVLIDSGTASAAEIVAAAIQDSGRGILLGETSYGKSSVQAPHALSDGSELRVTVARWFTPNGLTIEEGLSPDIEVGMTPEDLEAGLDPQKDRAVEYLKSMNAGVADSP